jgi:hypothetical protein
MDGTAEGRRRIASRILIGEGALILVVALVQLATAGGGALDRDVAGILLIPIGLTTIIAANGIAIGSEPAWRIAMINAAALLLLPFVLVLTITFGRPAPTLASLAPAIALSLIGITMVGPLLWARPGR